MLKKRYQPEIFLLLLVAIVAVVAIVILVDLPKQALVGKAMLEDGPFFCSPGGNPNIYNFEEITITKGSGALFGRLPNSCFSEGQVSESGNILVEWYCNKLSVATLPKVSDGTLIRYKVTFCDCDQGACLDDPICYDNDEDGFWDGPGCRDLGATDDMLDCDDTNDQVNPSIGEVCEDGIDNNCDGQIDEGCSSEWWKCEDEGEDLGVKERLNLTEINSGQELERFDQCESEIDNNHETGVRQYSCVLLEGPGKWSSSGGVMTFKHFDCPEGTTCSDGACKPQTANPELLSVEEGWDWSLPSSVQPGPYAGWAYIYELRRGDTETAYKWITTTWHLLNPEKDVYNWSTITDELGDSNFDGIIVRLKASNAGNEQPDRSLPAVPQWAIDEYTPGTFTPGKGRTYIQIWNEDLRREFEKFVQEFKRQGFPSDDRFLGMYIHGVSASSGEELYLEQEGAESLRSVGAVTTTMPGYEGEEMAQPLIETLVERAQLWVQAFENHKYKLAWINYGVSWGGEQGLSDKNNDYIADNVVALDIGYRTGGNERYLKHFNQDLNNLDLDANGYLISNWEDPIIAEGRIYADELEARQFWLDGSTPLPDSDYYFRSSILTSLAQGNRFAWSQKDVVNLIDNDLAKYWEKVAGKVGGDSPDAWSSLIHARMSRNECQTVNNVERGLHQRDVSGATTLPKKYYERGRVPGETKGHYVCQFDPYTGAMDPNDEYGADGEFAARSVDPDTGKMLFYVEDLFLDSSEEQDMKLHVTYVDNGYDWTITYCTANGPVTAPAIQGGSSTGQETTATWSLPGFKPTQCLGPSHSDGNGNHNGFDLEIAANPGDELTVQFVRLVRDEQ